MKKTNIKLTIIRFAVACLGILIFAVFTPMTSRLFTVWSFAGMGAGGSIVLCALFFDGIKAFFAANLKKRWFRIFFTLSCIFLAVCLIIALIFLWNILNHAFFTEEPPEDATVVVLGCQVRANKAPSKALRQRIDRAYEYLIANENAVCVASGGQGLDEPESEARVIYDCLVDMGIDPERIYVEDESHDTNQNMKYTAEIIEREGLSRNVAVITNSFHQYRASVYADHHGLAAFSVNSKTDAYAYPTYLLREVFAVVKMKIITA